MHFTSIYLLPFLTTTFPVSTIVNLKASGICQDEFAVDTEVSRRIKMFIVCQFRQTPVFLVNTFNEMATFLTDGDRLR